MDNQFKTYIDRYEAVRQRYERLVADRMSSDDRMRYNEVLFSAHSCAIEGNTFTVDDTRVLREQGLGMVPQGHTLLEAFEMLDHFEAFEHVAAHAGHALDESLLRETHRLVTRHTLGYRCPGAVPGEYTTTDMAAGDTVFGDHEQLVARVPSLLASTERAVCRILAHDAEAPHAVVVAARFHGFFEYLHPFRDGNGRMGRLLSNHILLRLGHPLIVIPSQQRQQYIAALKAIRSEGTDEHLVAFFFEAAIGRMEDALAQKTAHTRRFSSFVF